jgi:hypothetical protein
VAVFFLVEQPRESFPRNAASNPLRADKRQGSWHFVNVPLEYARALRPEYDSVVLQGELLRGESTIDN